MGGLASGNPAGIAAALAPPRLALGGPRVAPEAAAAGARAAAPHAKLEISITGVSNVTDGTGPTWYLLDTSRVVRPIVYQERRPFNFVAKDKPTDDNVFFQKKYIYGTDGRCNVGFGFWQLAHASRAPLTSDNYEAARNAMTTLRGDHDHRLGIMPTVLLVPMELEGAGRRILNTQLKGQTTTLDAGSSGTLIVNGAGSNEWAGSAELIVTPWL